MRYVYFNEDGLVLGFYDDEISQIPAGAVKISDEEYKKALSLNLNHYNKESKTFFRPPPTNEELFNKAKSEFISKIDALLNKEAQNKGYDNIVSAVSYAGYDNAFKAEAIAFGKWRAEIWTWGYGVMAKVKSGEIDINSDIDELIKSAPKLKLPKAK